MPRLPQAKATKSAAKTILDNINDRKDQNFKRASGFGSSFEFFITKHGQEARMVYSADLLNKIFSRSERGELKDKRKKIKINIRSIVNDESGLVKEVEGDSRRLKISNKQYPITSDIAIFGNKVRIATQKGFLAGLIIENKEISNTLKTLFDLAWEYTKILKKNKGSKK